MKEYHHQIVLFVPAADQEATQGRERLSQESRRDKIFAALPHNFVRLGLNTPRMTKKGGDCIVIENGGTQLCDTAVGKVLGSITKWHFEAQYQDRRVIRNEEIQPEERTELNLYRSLGTPQEIRIWQDTHEQQRRKEDKRIKANEIIRSLEGKVCSLERQLESNALQSSLSHISTSEIKKRYDSIKAEYDAFRDKYNLLKKELDERTKRLEEIDFVAIEAEKNLPDYKLEEIFSDGIPGGRILALLAGYQAYIIEYVREKKEMILLKQELARRIEKRDLEHKREKEASDEQIKTLREQLNNRRRELEGQGRKIHDGEVELGKISRERAEYKQTVDKLVRERELSDRKTKEIEEELKNNRVQQQNYEVELTNKRKELEALETKVLNFQEELSLYASVEADNVALRKELQDLRNLHVEATTQLENLHTEKRALDDRLHQVESRNQESESQVALFGNLSREEILVLYARTLIQHSYREAVATYDRIFPEGIDETVTQAAEENREGFLLTEDTKLQCRQAGIDYREKNLEELLEEIDERSKSFEDSRYYEENALDYIGACTILQSGEKGRLPEDLKRHLEESRIVKEDFEEQRTQWEATRSVVGTLSQEMRSRSELYILARNEFNQLREGNQLQLHVPLVAHIEEREDVYRVCFIFPTDQETKKSYLTRHLWSRATQAISDINKKGADVTVQLREIAHAKFLEVSVPRGKNGGEVQLTPKEIFDAVTQKYTKSVVHQLGMHLDVNLLYIEKPRGE